MKKKKTQLLIALPTEQVAHDIERGNHAKTTKSSIFS
jgi:hypothetical protein